MKYYDFICKTISNKNNIDWNYYGNHIDADDILQGNVSNTFIKQSFENEEKTSHYFSIQKPPIGL